MSATLVSFVGGELFGSTALLVVLRSTKPLQYRSEVWSCPGKHRKDCPRQQIETPGRSGWSRNVISTLVSLTSVKYLPQQDLLEGKLNLAQLRTSCLRYHAGLLWLYWIEPASRVVRRGCRARFR
jgi:hypothetical protein